MNVRIFLKGSEAHTFRFCLETLGKKSEGGKEGISAFHVVAHIVL